MICSGLNCESEGSLVREFPQLNRAVNADRREKGIDPLVFAFCYSLDDLRSQERQRISRKT